MNAPPPLSPLFPSPHTEGVPRRRRAALLPMADLLSAFSGLVSRLMQRIDYLALYPAEVIAQAGDGSLDLKPDDARMPGLTRVPLRYAVPGLRVKVKRGARVLLGFENGDASRPVATLWEEEGLVSLAFDATADVFIKAGGTVSVTAAGTVNIDAPDIRVGGGLPIARQGDAVVSISPGPPGLLSGMPITGTIMSGSTKAKA